MGKYQYQPTIKIGGAEVTEAFYDAVEEIVVDGSLHMPSMFTILLHDPSYVWVDDALLNIGKEVEISVEVTEEESTYAGTVAGVLIKGEITALEPDFSASGKSKMMVRGYDKSHRLHRGKKTRTWLSKLDSDLAKTIAGEAGLSAVVDATTVAYDWVIQSNQTNMEFLLARAERIGYQVHSAEGKLYFKKGDATIVSGTAPSLVYMENLLSFRPSWTAIGQANTMTVRGWDPKGKAAIVTEKPPNAGLNQGGMTQTGGAAANTAFGMASAIIADRPASTVDEATAIATGLSNDISRDFVQAEGVCWGRPDVKAGGKVAISKVGTRFSGEYFVTSATHIMDSHGYQTRFSISGRHPNTLTHLLGAGNGQGVPGEGQGLVFGVVPATVTNIDDPDDLGRVKVKYAWLGEIETWWARLVAPMAGPQRGFYCLPEVNDEVLVAFEHGDVHRPYVVGALWSSTDKPPKTKSEAIASGKVIQRVFKTRVGHLVVLSDKQSEEQICVTSKSGHTVILDDKSGAEKITIKDKSGNNSLVIDSTANSMTIKVNGDFIVDAKGKVNIKSGTDLALKAGTAGKIEATTELGLKGMTAKVENASGAKVVLQGPMVNIN